jgi:hypothetical protein
MDKLKTEILPEFQLPCEKKDKQFNFLMKVVDTNMYPTGVTLPHLLHRYILYDRGYWGSTKFNLKLVDRYEHRLRYRLDRLAERGMITKTRPDGNLVYVHPTECLLNLINTINYTTNSSPPTAGGLHKKRRTTSCWREQAQQRCKTTQHLQSEDLSYIRACFDGYRRDMENSRVYLLPRTDLRSTDVSVISVPRTLGSRYYDPEVKEQILASYNQLWAVATERHDCAVHMVITQDPRTETSIFEANTTFQKKMDILYKYLGRTLPEQPEKVERFTAQEFMDNGYLHAHVVLFGIDFLMPVWKFTRVTKEYRLGKITYLSQLKKDPTTGIWQWGRAPPTDANENNPEQYFQDYLSKGITDPEKQMMYWLFQKKYFTCSDSLQQANPRRKRRTGQSSFVNVGCGKDETADEDIKSLQDRISKCNAALFCHGG